MFLNATNIHQGGGKVLLVALLGILPEQLRVVVCLDLRCELPTDITDRVQIKRVKPTIGHRFKAEWWLARNVMPSDIVLCFGNLPPLFRLRGFTFVFVQNRYLVENVSLAQLPIKARFRIIVERMLLKHNFLNADEFVVQTPSMKTLLTSKIHEKVPVCVLPFMSAASKYQRRVEKIGGRAQNCCKFIYVASGEAHKNHRNLVNAWCILASEGLFPVLYLTVSKTNSTELCLWIEEKKKQHELRLENLGYIEQCEIDRYYTKVQALIYPSLFESFGLPLIEARCAGLPILASELDYVRDVVDSEESFDPKSPISIARAVKRFMGLKEDPLELLDARTFLQRILKRGASL